MQNQIDKGVFSFLKKLENNNNRDWFAEHKPRFKEAQNNAKAFYGAIQDRLNMHDEIEKMKIFRIYRDVRFSKDKTPYKTFVSAIVSRGGRKNRTSPGIYVQFSGEDARVYSGAYELDKNGLQNVRMKIASNLEEFNKLINDRKFKNK